jgi:hypothetical protein
MKMLTRDLLEFVYNMAVLNHVISFGPSSTK